MRTRNQNSDPVYAVPAPTYGGGEAPRLTPGVNSFGSFGPLEAQGTFPSSPVVVDLAESVITDDASPSKITKTVTHVKKRTVRYDIPRVEEYVDGAGSPKYQTQGPFAYNRSWGWYSGEDLLSSNPKAIIEFPKTVNELRRQAMTNFHSVNKADNLLNLVEASQLKQGASGVAAMLRSLSGRPGNARRFVGRNGVNLSNGYLFYSFGIAPLISDIKKISKGIVTLKHDLDEMIRMYNKPVRIVAQCSGVLKKNPSYTSAGYSDDHSTGFWDYAVYQQGPIIRRVGLRGRRNVDYQSDAFKKLHYVISRYVATGPASFVWERIPLSFVYDWFVDLSSIIDALDNAFTGFTRSIDDMWVSEKYAYIVPHKHFARPGYWITTADGRLTMQQELSYYHRSYLPPDVTIGASNKFGKKQASLLAALLHQLVANLRR